MNKKEGKLSTAEFYTCLILSIIAGISFFAINPIFGGVVGIFAWMIYKKAQKEISSKANSLFEETGNPETKQLIDTIIREQPIQKQKPYDYSSHLIRRGSLPSQIHDILDEMEITTWFQLSMLDEKELLYKKCFGEKALEDIKTELASRGLTLNGAQNTNS
jgi:DNA-directed RNA polymerase alpha subunit